MAATQRLLSSSLLVPTLVVWCFVYTSAQVLNPIQKIEPKSTASKTQMIKEPYWIKYSLKCQFDSSKNKTIGENLTAGSGNFLPAATERYMSPYYSGEAAADAPSDDATSDPSGGPGEYLDTSPTDQRITEREATPAPQTAQLQDSDSGATDALNYRTTRRLLSHPKDGWIVRALLARAYFGTTSTAHSKKREAIPAQRPAQFREIFLHNNELNRQLPVVAYVLHKVEAANADIEESEGASERTSTEMTGNLYNPVVTQAPQVMRVENATAVEHNVCYAQQPNVLVIFLLLILTIVFRFRR